MNEYKVTLTIYYLGNTMDVDVIVDAEDENEAIDKAIEDFFDNVRAYSEKVEINE